MNTNRPYTTASVITELFIDSGRFVPEAVRNLLVRPLPGCVNGETLFTVDVVFHDGTTYPVFASTKDKDIKRYCHRLSAQYDWPVHDGFSTGVFYPFVSGEGVESPLLSQEERETMQRIGLEIADKILKRSVSFEQAIDQVKDQLSAFIALSVIEGGLERDTAKEAAVEALLAAVQKLARQTNFGG